MGTDADYGSFVELVEACAEAGLQLTLLGYKRVGRGLARQPREHGWWLDAVRAVAKKRWLRLGVDTELARQYERQLRAAKIPSLLYDTREGAFSMYIDATTWTAGPSSYHPDAMRSLPAHAGAQEILGEYQSFDVAERAS
jgi:hypothetical protein